MTLQQPPAGAPTLADRAKATAEQLAAGGVKATADPAVAAATSTPIVLVGPPVRDFTRGLTTWQLACLAGTRANNLDTFHKLAALVAQLEAFPGLTVEDARPAPYQLTSEQPPVPAYLVRFTTS